MITGLADLIHELDAAEGPDRQLDLKIAVASGDIVCNDGGRSGWLRFSFGGTPDHRGRLVFMEGAKDSVFVPPPAVSLATGSIDAALALLSKMAPGWVVDHAGDDALGDVGAMRVMGHTVELTDGRTMVQGQAPTRALAYAIAVLKAASHVRIERALAVASAMRNAAPSFNEGVIGDVTAALVNFTQAFAMPEIENDDGTAILRWSMGRDIFTLTFMGQGSVTGFVSDGEDVPAWKVETANVAELLEKMNWGRASNVTLAE